MPAYTIHITDDAERDLAFYRPYERKQILDGIVSQLSYEPTVLTANRKQLRANPIATWELRIGRYRVFYEVEIEPAPSPDAAVETPQAAPESPMPSLEADAILMVVIISVGHKEHNVLYIRGKVIPL